MGGGDSLLHPIELCGTLAAALVVKHWPHGPCKAKNSSRFNAREKAREGKTGF